MAEDTPTVEVERYHNSYMTYLMYSADGATWEKFLDVTEIPGMGNSPNTLDTTTLSDAMHTYIEDILDTGGAMSFKSNYKYEYFKKAKELEGLDRHWAVWLGGELDAGGTVVPKGQYGKWKWTGALTPIKDSVSVGAVQTMELAITPSSQIDFE